MANTLARRTNNTASGVTGSDAFNSVGGGGSANLTRNTTNPIDGAADIHIAIAGTAAAAYGIIDHLDSGGTLNVGTAWPDLLLNMGTAPSVNTRIIRLRNGASTTLGGLQVTTSRKVRLVDQSSNPVGSDSDALSLNTTYRIGMKYIKDPGGTTGSYAAYLATGNTNFGTAAFASGTHSNALNCDSIRYGINDNAIWDIHIDNASIGDTGFVSLTNDPATSPTLTALEAAGPLLWAEWSYSGDSDGDTLATVEYREVGAGSWGTTPAIIDHSAKTVKAGHIVSGGDGTQFESISNLDGLTAYEVRLTLTDGTAAVTSTPGTITTLADYRTNSPLGTPYYADGGAIAWFSGDGIDNSGNTITPSGTIARSSFFAMQDGSDGVTGMQNIRTAVTARASDAKPWFLMYKFGLEQRCSSSNPSTAVVDDKFNSWVYQAEDLTDWNSSIDNNGTAQVSGDTPFLHATGGSAVRSNRVLTSNTFLMNPGSRAYKNFVRRRIIDLMRRRGSTEVTDANARIQGIELDNTGAKPGPGSVNKTLEYPNNTSQTQNDEYLSAVADFLDELATLGVPLWANLIRSNNKLGATGAVNDGLLEQDYLGRNVMFPFIEYFALGASGYLDASLWEQQADMVDNLLANGLTNNIVILNMSLTNWAVGSVPDQAVRFGWGSYQMVTDAARERVVWRPGNNNGYDYFYDTSKMNLALGDPVTISGRANDKRYKPNGTLDVWRRNQQFGITWLNTGTVAASVDGTIVPAQDTATKLYAGGVAFVNPQDLAEVNGTAYAVSWTKSGDVLNSELFIDDVSKAGPGTALSYTWDTTAYSDESHSLRLVGYADGGGSITAQAINASVKNSVPTLQGTVIITAPSSGGTVSGTVTCSGTVTGTDIDIIAWDIDGASIGVDHGVQGQGGVSNRSFDSTGYSEGSHTITAVGQSAGSVTIYTDQLSVIVDNDEPPTVSIHVPSNGGTVSGTVTVQVDASDDEDAAGSLTAEVSLSGGVYQSQVFNVTYYEYSWDTTAVSDGSHTIDARATDSAGQTTSASQISVTVHNVPAGTVTVTAPSTGGTISGALVDLTASHTGDVAAIRWEYDDQDSSDAVVITTSSVDPFSATFDSTLVQDASLTLRAVGLAADLTTELDTDEVTVTVDNGLTGTVSIDSPNDGDVFSGHRVAVVLSSTGDVASLALRYNEDLPLGTLSTTSGTITFDPYSLTSGTIALQAVGLADDGLTPLATDTINLVLDIAASEVVAATADSSASERGADLTTDEVLRRYPRAAGTAVFEAGRSVSNVVDLAGVQLSGLVPLTGWTNAAVTFQVFPFGGTATAADLFDMVGEVTVGTASAVAGQYVVLDPRPFSGLRYLRLRSGTAGSAVAQSSGGTILLYGRRF